jgi:hypothetical protein
MHEIKHHPVTEDTLNEGFESSDMRISLIAMVFIGIGVVSVITSFVIIGLMYLFNTRHEALNPVKPMPTYQAGGMAPGYDGPIVETTPREDRDAYLKVIKAKLNSYGVVSEEPGMERAHIPIEEAMRQLAAGEVAYKAEPQQALVQ